MIFFKGNQCISDLSQPMRTAAVISHLVIEWLELRHLVITSTTDGVHVEGSKHYEGGAIDIRTRDWKEPDVVAQHIKRVLGHDFDVILESDHLHIEYDPPA